MNHTIISGILFENMSEKDISDHMENMTKINILVDKERSTLLHYAPTVELVQKFVRIYPHINICTLVNNQEQTALHTTKYCDVAEYLMKCGIQANVTDKHGYSPLHFAKHDNIAELLLCKGADVNFANVQGNTPLMLTKSVKRGEILIKYGADVNKTNNAGNAILHDSALPLDFVKLLLENQADPNIRGMYGNRPLHNVVSNENASVLLKYCGLLMYMNDKGQTPIHTAKTDNIIKIFAKYKPNFNKRDKDGKTVLHYCKDGLMNELFKHKADPNIPDNDGNTPFHGVRTKYGLELFMKNGGSLKIENNEGNTPLFYIKKYIDQETIDRVIGDTTVMQVSPDIIDNVETLLKYRHKNMDIFFKTIYSIL